MNSKTNRATEFATKKKLIPFLSRCNIIWHMLCTFIIVVFGVSWSADAREVSPRGVREKRQGLEIPLASGSALLACLIPGFRNSAFCAGPRLALGIQTERRGEQFFGYKDGTELPIVGELGLRFLRGRIGSNHGTIFKNGATDFGSSDRVLGE